MVCIFRVWQNIEFTELLHLIVFAFDSVSTLVMRKLFDHISLEEFSGGLEAVLMGNGHLGMFRVACCAAVWSGIVSADVIKQGGFNLGLDVVVVDALTNKPWDPGVRGVQGIGQECVSVLKLETLL